MIQRFSSTDVSVSTLVHGSSRYSWLFDQLCDDVELATSLWEDAESRPSELDVPGTLWTVVTVRDQLAAWCAARLTVTGRSGEVLKCFHNYEVPRYRGHDLYERAYRRRHRDVILPFSQTAPIGSVAVTYLFSQPIPLHLADNWCLTGVSGVSRAATEPHEWWELELKCGAVRTTALAA